MGVLSKAVRPPVQNSTNLVGAPSFAKVNPYGLYNHYKDDKYASIYPNIRPIVNDVTDITPYAIDGNGKPVQDAPAVNALFHPNKTDSFFTFTERLTVSALNLPFTYILVWRNEGGKARPGGDFGFKGKNIVGYTFLENPAVEYRDGRIYYSIGAQTFTEDEVMAIPGGAQPYDLYAGYSPALSVAKWATIDGYIADFEKGFFENNAIPAGMFSVVAPTKTDYDDMVDKLQEKHRGAGNNNNVTYSWTPVDTQGKPSTVSSITWTPFQQSNKDIDFDVILTHTDKKLGESYGVSSIIKGDDSQAKYSNAEVSEANYTKRAVKPTAKRIYTQITHELNRMTGGLGYAITFKLDIPAVADSDRVKALTKQTEGEIILKFTAEPYNWSLDSVVDAFKLSQSYKLLKEGDNTTKIENDKPEVDEGGEVQKSPDRTEIDGVTPLNKVKMLTESELELYEAQISEALNNSLDDFANDEGDDESGLAGVIAALIALTLFIGGRAHTEAIGKAAAAGYSIDNIPAYTSDEAIVRLRATEVVKGFNSDTKESLEALKTSLDKQTLDEVDKQSWKQSQASRVDRFSKNESWHGAQQAENRAYTLVAEAVAAAGTASSIAKKTWVTQAGACSICENLSGKTVGITESFGDFTTPPAHVWCRCNLSYSFIEKTPSNSIKKLHCSKCDRYLGDTASKNFTDKLKCKCSNFDVPAIKEPKDVKQ